MGFSSGASQATLDAVKAKTDNLPASPANQTTVTAVKTKTDLIPASPADQTTVAAVKAKTDILPASPASETTLGGKPNEQEVVIYPMAEDAATTELADDGSSPAYYPAAAHSTAANAEGAPGVAWSEHVDLEQEGTITVTAIYAEFEWQTRFLVGAGAGTQSSSKIQISRDGGATWVDLTDNFNNAATVMTNRVRAGVGRWVTTIVAGTNQLAFRLVHWTNDAGGVSTSEAQIRSNSFVRLTYRKA